MTQKAARLIEPTCGARGTHAPNRWALAVAIGFAIVCGGLAAARADVHTSTFENPPYTLGSIDTQDGWSGGGALSTDPIGGDVHQAVTSADAFAGSQSWFVSNDTSLGDHNGAFGGWPFGPPLTSAAGQPSSSAPSDKFFATFWFKAGSTSADGSNMEVDLGTVDGDDRNSFLAITNRADADGGLQLRINEPVENNLGGCDNFYPILIAATGLDRTVWHRMDFKADFIDGDYNDTIQYFLDGVPVINTRTGGTTWFTFESYRNQCSFAYAQTNRIYFRSGREPSVSGAFSDTAAAGILFDNLIYETPSCGPRYVATTGTDIGDNQCDVALNPCLTIQHAINVACVGDTINVAAGTYNEQVQINKTLTIKGAQAGVDARTRVPTSESIIDNACGPVQIMADNVVLDGFTVQGSTLGDPCFLSGIWTNPGHSGTDGGHQILNNIVQNNISGIELDSTCAADPTLVQFNLIQNNNNAGPGSGNAIQTNFVLCNATIDSNKFSGHTNSSVLVNSFSGSDGNITVSNNELVGGSAESIAFLAVTNSTIIRNTSSGSTSSGTIDLFGGNSNITVTENLLANGTNGVVVENPYLIYGVDPNSCIIINDNCIHGNSVAGLDVETSGYDTAPCGGNLDATSNWWGAADGPSGVGPGSGDAIVDPDGVVDFSPFLTAPAASCPCTVAGDCEDGNVCTTDTCSAGVNLALSGTASQSSTLTGFDVGAAPSCTGATSPPGADRANDGDTDGNYYSGCSVAVTQSEAQPWWQVDLGASQLITSIEVWNRTDVSGATTDFHVLVSDDPTFTTNVFDYHDSGTAGTPTTVSAVNATGRYVRVQLSGTDYLQLAEVKVFGGGCTSTNNTDPCDDDLFCTGADTCGGGTCSTHAGDPCTGGGECANFCDEALDTCNLPNTEPCTTDSNVCTLDFCDGAGACAHTPGNAGTECRTSAGVCDVAESCNGIDAACPTDGFQSSSIQCRAPGGACGLAENCTGSAAACPADLNKTPGTVCRASTGVCDPQEVCTGTATCPTQVLTPAGTQCRAPGGACGLAEVCDGSTGACPTDLNKAPGTVCRASTGVCDPQEVCTGTATCPTQVLTPAGTQCRAPGGACGLAEVCDGSTGACPTDLNKAPGTVCRASTGVCDPQEVCTGTATCPTQVLSPAGTECRASTAGCDPAENCTGTAATCPTDINTCS